MAKNMFSTLARAGELTSIPLSGLQGVGANMAMVMTKDEVGHAHAVIVDAGVTYDYAGNLPVEAAMYDPRDLLADDNLTIHGIVQTHGHEDHIGTAPLNAMMGWFTDVPIYGPQLSTLYTQANLAGASFEGQPLPEDKWPDIKTFMPGETLELGPLRIDSCAVEHSMAHSTMVRVRHAGKTGDAHIFSGDLRLNGEGKLGWSTDFPTLHQWGDDGVTAFYMESTNALGSRAPGTEADVNEALDRFIKDNADKEIWLTGLSRNSQRMATVFDVAARNGLGVILDGYSMVKSFEALKVAGLDPRQAAEVKVLSRKDATRMIQSGKADPKDFVRYITGPLGGNGTLQMLVNGERDHAVTGPDVVIGALQSGIPGTEEQMAELDAGISASGAKIVRPSDDRQLSVSGHYQLHEAPEFVVPLRPQAVIPLHGGPEQRAALAGELSKPHVAREIGHELRLIQAENGTPITGDSDGGVHVGETLPVSFVGFRDDQAHGFQKTPVYGLSPDLFADKGKKPPRPPAPAASAAPQPQP